MKKIIGLFIFVCMLGQLAMAQDKAPKDCTVAEIDSILTAAIIAKDFEKIIPYAQVGAEKAAAQYGKEDTTYAKMRYAMGLGFVAVQDFVNAEKAFTEAKNIQKIKAPKSLAYISTLTSFANFYRNIGDYSSSEALYKENIPLIKEILGKEHPSYASNINGFGAMYMNLGNYDLAEAFLMEAMLIRKQVLGENHLSYAQSLNNLAVLYDYTNSYTLAEPLYREALKIRKELLGEKHPDYASSMNNLGALYMNMNKYGEAERAFKQVLQIRLEILGENDINYAKSLNNLGIMYQKIKKDSLAEPLFMKALKIRKGVLGDKNEEYASILNNLALMYQNMKKMSEAEALFIQASDLYKEVLGEKHPFYVMSLNNLADFYAAANNAEKSWAYLEQSLRANIAQNISLNINQGWADTLLTANYNAPNLIMATLANCYGLLEKDNSSEAKAKQVIVAELVLRILENRRNDFSEEGDKLLALSQSSDWVWHGVAVLDLDKDGEKAFVFAEQSKSVLLLNAAQTKQAYTFGDLPDSLVQKEKKLQQQKTDLEAKIAENRPKVQIDSLRSLLNDLNLQIKDFKTTIEKSYPKYAELKYEHKGANVADIQKLLPAESALIEYVVGKNATYIFYLDKKQLKISRLDISADSLKTRAEKLHRCLSNYAEIRADEAKAYSDYTEIAHWFYENMLAEPLKNAQNIKHLIIIPDGDLAHLPFETFLRAKADPQGNYSQLAYVVNDFSVSYNYSATLWKQNLAKSARKNNGLMLGIAANYATKLDSSKYDLRLPADQRLRKLLNVLPAAEKEVKTLSESFKGLFAFDNMASEKAFKANAGKYSIIHLAMHGLLDNQNPILSSLAFTEDSDSVENNFLHAYEISKMQLNADLVVLSACETGFGKFEQGNGTASLARAFMYAGVPALVVSLWEVNDGSTNILMQAFYKNLSAGMDKAEALRQAKLQYISNANGTAAHPAFWSAFIQLGDSAPIDMHGGGSWWLFWAIGAAVALGLGAVIWYKRGSK